MFLFPALPHADYLKDHVAEGTLRAAANFDAGRYAGVAFATAPSSADLGPVKDLVCPGDPGCIGTILQKVGSVQSGHKEGEFNVFATATVAPGTIRAVLSAFRDLPDPPPTVRVAASFAIGAPDFHLVFEFVGDDLQEVTDRLLLVLDIPEVVSFDTFFVSPRGAFGFGSELAQSD